jgi:hypothetical protein
MVQNEVARAALEVTRQWAVDELEAARVRVTNLRCGGEAYNHAIYAIGELTRTIDQIGFMLGENHPAEIMHVAPPADPTESDAEPIVYTETPADEPEPEPEKTVVLVDISEVRTKAKEARDAGVKLPEVWKAFGGAKLSDVPAAKYNELMDLLDSKMKESGS